MLKQAGAVTVPSELLPGSEHPSGEGKPRLPELLLGAQALGVGGEVPDQMGESKAGASPG